MRVWWHNFYFPYEVKLSALKVWTKMMYVSKCLLMSNTLENLWVCKILEHVSIFTYVLRNPPMWTQLEHTDRIRSPRYLLNLGTILVRVRLFETLVNVFFQQLLIVTITVLINISLQAFGALL
jgi:hypothetical protein